MTMDRRNPGKRRLSGRSVPARRIAAAIAAVLVALPPAAGIAQEEFRAELAVIGEAVLGDWWERRSLYTPSTVRIRLEPDGRFLHGTEADFGTFPSRWEARRLTLVRNENLIVRWADRGTCIYYVAIRIEDGIERMTWRPYRDDRDLGGFDSILFRALLPWGDCRPEEWQRQPPPPPKPIPDFPD